MSGQVNTPEAIALLVLLPIVLAVAVTYAALGLRGAVRRLLDGIEAWLDRKIARHVDLALSTPWNDGLDQAAVDRIWAAMQDEMRDAS